MLAHHFTPMLLAELTPAVAGTIFLVWLFAMGGAVGSFLNVVVYRLPAQESIVRPGSHCPICNHPIRWHDNIPLLSWFLLRGRCRDCAAEISFRYPAVEAITAALFVLVGAVEGLTGGGNLPPQRVAMVREVVLPPLGIGQSAGIVTYHLLLLCTLVAAALIEYDGHAVRLRLLGPALAVGWLAPAAWPHLHPVPAWWDPSGPITELLHGAAGFVAGMVLGATFRLLPDAGRGLGLLLGPACVGLFLGWQAVLVLTAATVLVHLLFCGLRRTWPGLRPIPPTAWLALCSLSWILVWGWIVGRCPLLG